MNSTLKFSRKLREIFTQIPNSPILKNAITVYLVQIISYLFPVITVPLVARLLGPIGLGNFGYVLQVSAFMTLIIDYGFIISAVRNTAKNQSDLNYLSNLMSEIFSTKAFIAGVIFMSILVFPGFTPAGIEHEWMFLAWLLSVSQAFGLFWLFQGLERMQIPGALDFITKILTLLGIYLISRSTLNVSGVLYCYIMAGFCSLAFAYWFTINRLGIRLKLVKMSEIYAQLRNGWNLLITRLVSNNLSLISGILLAWLVSREAVGYYFAADRLIRAILAFVWPVSIVMVPHLSRIAYEERSSDRLKTINISFLKYGGLLTLFFAIIFTILAKPLVLVLRFGPAFEQSILIFRVLALLIPLNFLANVITQQWLIPLKLDNALIVVYLAAVLVLIAAIFVLVPSLSAMGMAISVLLAEFTIVVVGLVVLKTSKKL
jgi:polysaccharide transporter, PST family